MLERLFAEEPRIDPERCYIGGFSNGANTIAALLNDPDTRAGLLESFNGFIFVEGGRQLHPTPSLRGLSFLLVNGEESSVPVNSKPESIENEWLRPVAEALRAVGADVTYWQMEGVGHGFPSKEKERVRAWLEPRPAISE